MRTNLSPARRKNLAEAAALWGGVFRGNLRSRADIVEALSTSDFQVATGDMLDRELLSRYEALPTQWQRFAKRTTVKDFKVKNFIALGSGLASLELVPELSEYPADKLDSTKYPISAKKYGKRFAISWEQVINDDLGEYEDLPDLLAQAARNSEDRAAAEILAQANGVNTAFFKAANGNAPAALPLTRENLQSALSTISTRKDPDGNPFRVRGFVLVVPPALEAQANAILSATEVRETVDGVTTIRTNDLQGKVTVAVNDWLPVVNTSAKANTTWYIVPDPNGPRVAVAVAFLRGHEQPDLRLQNATGVRVGGGNIDPFDGSFEIDDIQYRVRHPHGAAGIDPLGTYASTGS